MKTHLAGEQMLHADGQMDRHEEGYCRFSKFCVQAYKGQKQVKVLQLN